MTLRQYLSHRMLISLLSARMMSDALPFLYVSITYRMTCLRNRHCAAAGRVEHGHAHAAIIQGGFGQANQSSSSVAPRQLCRDTLVIVHVGDVRYAHSCKRCRGSPRLASGPSVFLLLSPRALSSQRTNKGKIFLDYGQGTVIIGWSGGSRASSKSSSAHAVKRFDQRRRRTRSALTDRLAAPRKILSAQGH